MSSKIINLFTGIIFFLTILSCKQQKKEKNNIGSIKSFPVKKDMRSVKTNKANFKKANLFIFDSLLVLTHTDSKEIIHVYNKNTFTHITSSGTIGKGKGELTRPFWNTWEEQKDIIWYPDMGKREGRIFKYKIDSILKDPQYNPPKPFKIPSNIRFTKTIYPYSGRLFSYAVDNPAYYFYVANKNGKIIDSLNLPNKTNIYPNLNRKNIMTTIWYYYKIHPSKKKVFIAYHYADIIVCTDLKGNVLYQKKGPDGIQEEAKHLNPKQAVKDERKTTYWCIRADEEFVYCLYSGRNFFRMENNKTVPQYAKTILIYTWEGEPIIKLNLDRPATKFAIDKENNRIVAFAKDIGELVYYNFSFKKLGNINSN